MNEQGEEDAATLAQAPADEDAALPVAVVAVVHIQGCTGKIGYGSKGSALGAASRYLKIDTALRPAPLGLRCYFCRHCHLWHLTSKV